MEPSNDIFGRAFQVRVKERLLRDPVHGLIPIDENTPQGRLVTRLIDCAEMQRLRRIRQLGLANLAFQGAEHSRFSHAVGAFHMARLVIGHLTRMYTIDSELGFMAQVAALLHDLGHGPFSHVSERVFGGRHEEWTIRLLHDSRTEVNAILESHSRRLPSMIESILKGMAKPGYLSSLVSGELDADRLDYLQRDSLMTGVKYGVFDLDRLVHTLRISPEGDRIILAAGGLLPAEKYAQARYHMHRQVYRHKTVTAAEAMLESLLRRAADLVRSDPALLEGPSGPLDRILADPAEAETPDYLELDDAEVLGRIKIWARTSRDPVLRDLSARLLNRRLFKTIDLPSGPGAEERIAEARRAVEEAGLPPEYYFVVAHASATLYGPEEADAGGGKGILIENASGGIVDIASVSPTIRAFKENPYRAARAAYPGDGAHEALRKRIEGIFKTG